MRLKFNYIWDMLAAFLVELAPSRTIFGNGGYGLIYQNAVIVLIF